MDRKKMNNTVRICITVIMLSLFSCNTNSSEVDDTQILQIKGEAVTTLIIDSKSLNKI